MVAFGSNDPVNFEDLQTDIYDGAGYLVKYDASGVLKTAAKADTPIGVTIDESSRGDDYTQHAVADATVAVLPLSGVIFVKCEAIVAGSVKQGMPLYVSDTNNGYADDDSSSATLLGYYFGKGGVAITAGQLVPVSVA